MGKTTTTALNALEAIKGIVLSHMEQDVDYDYEENPEYYYHEEYDGTVGDNYSCEIAFIEKALKALGAIKNMHDCQANISKILNDIEESDDYQDFSFNYSEFPKEDYEALKGILG